MKLQGSAYRAGYSFGYVFMISVSLIL